MKMSLGQAWEESKAVLRRDGSLIAAVALALLVLPGTVVGLFLPPGPAQEDPGAWQRLLILFGGLLGLVGQLAISRIALGPSTTVGGAIATAFRRLPIFFLAMFLVTLPILLFVVTPLLIAGNGKLPEEPSPVMAVLILLLFPIFIYILVRMLLVSPLAVDTKLGPIGLLREGWALSRGRALRLFGLILLIMLVALVLVVGLGGAISTVAILALGQPEPGGVSALLIALVQQLLNAIVSSGFAVMLARLYVQARGAGAGVSVPSAGGD